MARRRNRRRGALGGVATVAATIVFLPCIFAMGGGILAKKLFRKARTYERPKTRARRESRERKKDILRGTPRRLEPRLQRHLTIGRPEKEEEEEEEEEEDVVDLGEEKGEIEMTAVGRMMTRTDGQLQSGLFRLPLEIRRRIWEDAIGGYVIHVYFVEAYRRMSHTRCKSRTPEVCRGISCREIFKVKGALDEWGNAGLLPLLQTCRRIYSEAMEILYTANTFDFESLNDVLKLSLVLLPERMRLMKDVQWKPIPTNLNYCNNTPWLNCRAPLACCCMTCWPKAIGIDEGRVDDISTRN